MSSKPSTHSNLIHVYALMFLATFFWAGAFIAGKLGINALSPVLITFMRMGLASLIMFPILTSQQRTSFRLTRKQLPMVMATGLIGMIGYHLFFFSALRYTTASKAAMINACNPLLTSVIAAALVGEKLTFRKIGFILMAFCGVIYIMIGGDFSILSGMALNKGDLLMLCGTLCWAIYSVLVRRFLKDFGALKLTTYTFTFGTLLLLPFALHDIIGGGLVGVGLNPYLAVIYMAIFPTVIGYSIQQYAIGKIGPSNAALFINMVPILTTLMAVMFLGEQVAIYHFVGAALIILAVIGYSYKR